MNIKYLCTVFSRDRKGFANIFFLIDVLNVSHKSEQNTRAHTSSKAQQSPLNKERQKTFLDPSLYQDLQQDLIGSILGWGPSSSHVFWKSFW